MDYHSAPGHPPIPCLMGRFGACAICARIDPGSPGYSEGHRRLFHPEEFPGDAPPAPIPSTFPSVATQGMNFIRSAAKHVVAGAPRASEAETARRRAICETCPARVDDRCSKCGCYLRAKTAWALEKCPDDRWWSYQ